MAEQVVNPIMPNPGQLSEAMAGAQAVTFTATDRKIIEERGGEIDKTKSFKELFFKKDITHKVENQEASGQVETDVKAVEMRKREHERMLKNSPIVAHREHVEISASPPYPADTTEIKAEIPEKKLINKETAAMAKDLYFKPADLLANFTLEQKELQNLICRIKELHLQRLFSGSRKDFEALSEKIEQETMSSTRPEARAWLRGQLTLLTKRAAEYKLNLLNSMHSIHVEEEHQENSAWLKGIIEGE
ncbi:MAG: hypothetical protein PHH14_01410 [Candidatus Margulisbacteria bacterium]|nr:hypothetical protein [Candidatus Margulisiibacteriota bacterium]